MAKKPKPQHEPEVEKAKNIGRPTAFRPEFVGQAAKLCALGATDMEIADFFDVSVRTIHRWKLEHPDFCHSIKNTKDIADERVERSLYQRALGYTVKVEKLFNNGGTIIKEDTYEHVVPDTTAMIFWLKNRRKDEWRDRQDVKHEVTNNGPSPEFLEFAERLKEIERAKRLTIEHQPQEKK